MTGLIQSFTDFPTVDRFASALDRGARVVGAGSFGSSCAILSGALFRRLDRSLVLVTAHLDEAEEVAAELSAEGLDPIHLPSLHLLPDEAQSAADLLAERVAVVRAVLDHQARSAPFLLVAPIHALMQSVPPPESLDGLSRLCRRGDRLDPQELIQWLDAAGYSRVDAVEEAGEYAVRGGILDVFPPGTPSERAGVVGGVPVRLDFFGDELDRLSEIDLETMGSDRTLQAAELFAAQPNREIREGVNILTLIDTSAVAVLHETLETVEQARGFYERLADSVGVDGPPAVLKLLETRFHGFAEINRFSTGATSADERHELPVAQLPSFAREPALAIQELVALAKSDTRVMVTCQNEGELSRFKELLQEFAPGPTPGPAPGINAVQSYVHRGFLWDPDAPTDAEPRLAVVPYHELLHRYHQTRARRGSLRTGRAMDTFLDLRPGDHVVHAEHGIARFAGLKLMKPESLPTQRSDIADEPQEYLTLEFAGRSRLHVPASQIDLVQKYVGGSGGKPALSTIGGQKWKHQKEKVAESVRDLAAEMLRVRAAREHIPGTAFPPDTTWQKEFEAEFPHQETEDQLAAIAEIKADMQTQRPMDRLICGDVGFGKTEIAIRAAFKACEFGKQVAVLVPTTVLAEQHERTFRSRMAGYPFRIESLSRFKSTKQINETLAAVRKGAVDIVIGTHRLLSKDVRFADLGLVIVDEEQRFGVEHKERLLKLRMTVDVLTLSATPIPRTLHMAMLGLRDISNLTTPPIDRRAVVTEVLPYNKIRIARAIRRELSREGQIYFLHNRVHNIKSVADDVQQLVPEARIAIGHGQMDPHELEKVMLDFVRRQVDVLVCTTIIESGIDIPTANTIIINDADRFGLADLHQLRGRVGRDKDRAYCLLLLPLTRTITEVAQRRLRAIEHYAMLGAGFKIAMRDLEIRGAGNLLGAEQSGHIAAVGYEMYCRLLEHAVRDLKNEPDPKAHIATTVELAIPAHIPRAYIPAEHRRLEAYRRIATAADDTQLATVEADLVAAYGDPPRQVRRLLDLARIRIAAAGLDVRALVLREQDLVFRSPNPAKVAQCLRARPQGTVRVLEPKSNDTLHEVYFRPPPKYLENSDTLLSVLKARLTMVPEPAETTAI